MFNVQLWNTMQIKVIDVKTKRVPLTENSSLNGNLYEAMYVVSKWSWSKIGLVKETKHAYKLPVHVHFRDSETGSWVSSQVDNAIREFIDLKEYEQLTK